MATYPVRVEQKVNNTTPSDVYIQAFVTTIGAIAPDGEHLSDRLGNTKGRIKSRFVEPYTLPVVAVTATAPEVPSTAGVYYFNTTDDTLYYVKETTTGGTTTYSWAKSTVFSNTSDILKSGTIFVNVTDNKLYHYHDNAIHQVGGASVDEATSTNTYDAQTGVTTTSYNLGIITLSTVSKIAREMASEMIASAQGGNFNDALYTYDDLTNN